MLPADLPAELERIAAQAEEYTSDPGAVKAYRKAAELARQAWAEWQDGILSLNEAARESGYSAEHLQRLVANGDIPNAGQKGKPRVRRGDLPKKAVAGNRGPSVSSSTLARRGRIAALPQR